MDEDAPKNKKEITKWTQRMEDAYQVALAKAGGLEVAKPKAVHQYLKDDFPDLTLQSTKWHLLAHRRREERHREMGVPEQQILKWTGRLEEAYEAAVQQLGGLQAARPKQLLQILQPEFPDLQLQSIKWHLQKQRTKQQQQQQQQQQATTSSQQQGSLQRQQPSQPTAPRAAGRRKRASAGEAGPGSAADSAVGAGAGTGTLRASGSSSMLTAGDGQTVQQAAPQPTPGQSIGQGMLGMQQVQQQQLGGPGLQGQPSIPQPLGASGIPTLQSTMQRQHSGSLARPLHLSQAQQAQQAQQQQGPGGWQWPRRFHLLPWEHYLLPAAQTALARVSRTAAGYRENIAMLQQRAGQLEQLISLLESGQDVSSEQGPAYLHRPQVAAGAAAFPQPSAFGVTVSGAAGDSLPSLPDALGSLQLSLLASAAPLAAPALRPASAGRGGSGSGGTGTGSGGSGSGDAAQVPSMAQRQSRTQQAIASQFGVLREGSAVAAAAAMVQQQQLQLQQDHGEEHLLSCTVPGCRRCAWLLKLQDNPRQPRLVPASQPAAPPQPQGQPERYDGLPPVQLQLAPAQQQLGQQQQQFGQAQAQQQAQQQFGHAQAQQQQQQFGQAQAQQQQQQQQQFGQAQAQQQQQQQQQQQFGQAPQLQFGQAAFQQQRASPPQQPVPGGLGGGGGLTAEQLQALNRLLGDAPPQ